jgi:protein-S-isoprenylcysteine O-methyltransferase Ste14
MKEADQLLVLTQVAIAVAGFAGIVGAFQFKEGEKIKRGDAVGLAIIVNTGLMSAFYSTLPLLLTNLGISDTIVWAICSGFTCIVYTYFNIDFAIRLKNFKSYKTINKIMVYSLFIVSFIIIVINFLNASNIVFKREFGPFYISLVYSIGSVCYMFSRLLLRPIWRTIRKQESENLTDNDL